MSRKKINVCYKPKDIYFGCFTYNGGREGYYKSFPRAFVKKLNANDEVVYEDMNTGKQVYPYTTNTPKYLTVSELVCLEKLVSEEIKNKYMSRELIRLYLFKHKLNYLFKDEIELIEQDKTIVKK